MKVKTILAGVVGVGIAVLIAKNHRALKSKPDLFIRNSLPGNFNAITAPPFGIFIRADQVTNAVLLRHELVHWDQYQRLGLLDYYVTYLGQYIGVGYDSMALEQEARQEESPYCQSNYTSCVRDGLSLTVHNPNFRS